MKNLNVLLQHCIAEATNELGPKLLNSSEVYADLSRRILAIMLEEDSALFSPSDQIITARLVDVETWIKEAYGMPADLVWRLTPVGWKPSILPASEQRP